MVACAYGNPACKHIGIGILALCVSCALLAPCVGAMRSHARHRQSARSGSARTRKRGTPVLVGPFARARAGCRISLPLRRGCVPLGAERSEPFGRFPHKGGALRRFARNVLRAVGGGSAVSEPGGNGFEFCGRYARPVGERTELGKRDPLTDTESLMRFLHGLHRVPGANAARRATAFVLDGSMSPMETSSVLYLCLPASLGGYGLPLPQMNAVVPVSAKDRAYVGKSYYQCDLYWPEARFAIEYDSNVHHTGAARIADDASRRTDLAYLGIEVATLTQGQVSDRRELDRIARLLAKRLGKRLRMERINPSGAQDRLRACLLDSARNERHPGRV